MVPAGRRLARRHRIRRRLYPFAVASITSASSLFATCTPAGGVDSTIILAGVWPTSTKYRTAAVQQFGEKLRQEASLRDQLWTLSGVRLVCHCLPSQSCHADEITREYRNLFPEAYDREAEGADPPGSDVLIQVGSVLAHPWWSVLDTRTEKCAMVCPWPRWDADLQSVERQEVAERERERERERVFARREVSPDLLMQLALGRVSPCPFSDASIATLKQDIVEGLTTHGRVLKRSPSDRSDLPIDYSFLELLLDRVADPGLGMEQFAQGARIGVGSRLLLLSFRLLGDEGWIFGCVEEQLRLDELVDKVEELMEDQASREQVLKERKNLEVLSRHEFSLMGHTASASTPGSEPGSKNILPLQQIFKRILRERNKAGLHTFAPVCLALSFRALSLSPKTPGTYGSPRVRPSLADA